MNFLEKIKSCFSRPDEKRDQLQDERDRLVTRQRVDDLHLRLHLLGLESRLPEQREK